MLITFSLSLMSADYVSYTDKRVPTVLPAKSDSNVVFSLTNAK